MPIEGVRPLDHVQLVTRFRSRPPHVAGAVPGARSAALAARLSAVESRNVTYLSPDFPVFWERGLGSNVWDVDGNRYVDLTAAFGVVSAGHSHPAIVEAIGTQVATLAHGMGDVHPPAAKVELLERLVAIASPGARAVLATSGSAAVEIALKTATLYTGRPGFLAFSGGYHGLTYGALAVTDRELFRRPFEAQLNPYVLRAAYPKPPRAVAEAEEAALSSEALCDVAVLLDGPGGDRVGAIIVEPAQGRGGQIFPPSGFVAGLADLCRERGLLLIADEIFTGFGRTGWPLACDAENVIPDLVCVGKGMSGGMPISACIGSSEAMAAWPESAGEAIHTSTFLGHPAACAAALATLQVIDESDLAARSGVEGTRWLEALREMTLRHPIVREVRGRGLMIGIELRDPELRVPGRVLVGRATVEAMRRGWILLGAGPEGDVISLSPPLTIERELLELAVAALDGVLGAVEASLA